MPLGTDANVWPARIVRQGARNGKAICNGLVARLAAER